MIEPTHLGRWPVATHISKYALIPPFPCHLSISTPVHDTQNLIHRWNEKVQQWFPFSTCTSATSPLRRSRRPLFWHSQPFAASYYSFSQALSANTLSNRTSSNMNWAYAELCLQTSIVFNSHHRSGILRRVSWMFL